MFSSLIRRVFPPDYPRRFAPASAIIGMSLGKLSQRVHTRFVERKIGVSG
jgi:hypothetical protein